MHIWKRRKEKSLWPIHVLFDFGRILKYAYMKDIICILFSHCECLTVQFWSYKKMRLCNETCKALKSEYPVLYSVFISLVASLSFCCMTTFWEWNTSFLIFHWCGWYNLFFGLNIPQKVWQRLQSKHPIFCRRRVCCISWEWSRTWSFFHIIHEFCLTGSSMIQISETSN